MQLVSQQMSMFSNVFSCWGFVNFSRSAKEGTHTGFHNPANEDSRNALVLARHRKNPRREEAGRQERLFGNGLRAQARV